MKTVSVLFLSLCCLLCKAEGSTADPSLKDALKKHFLMGVAMNNEQIDAQNNTQAHDVIIKHFNSIVAENCMKSESLQPREGLFDFSRSDRFVAFGEKHQMQIIGHTLIWHSQAPKWFFVDDKGNQVSRDVLVARMKQHITTVVKRYKGRVAGWDVVNEAINDDGTWRESPFYKIVGKDYIKLAFQFAREADPSAELHYNDYSMALKGKRDSVVRMVNELKQQGIKVDAIGMQGHLTMDFPTIEEFEKSILAFASTGARVMITEMDISVLPSPDFNQGADVSKRSEYDSKLNPYSNGLPSSVAMALHNRYADFFRLFLKHSDKISRVTVWGVCDSLSWRNYWPVRGRTDYPLLFDRNYQPKPIVKTIISEATR